MKPTIRSGQVATSEAGVIAKVLVLCLLVLISVNVAKAADTTWLKDAKYGLFIQYINGLNDITGQYNDGTWDATVNAFDVNTFANQAEQAGAKYVIFAIGQSNGYYCAPSTQFTTVTGYQNGTFCSNRDLISDLYAALNPKGIKLMVYMASEGPSGAPAIVCNPFSANGTANIADFRTKFNTMVSEWSVRWGSKVAGWWLDGCWIDGYNTPTDGSDGPTNLTNLINACRAGNANSIVSCNPLCWQFVGKSVNQDYLTGECNVFGRFPLSRYVTYNGANIQWHTTSFIGKWWGEPSIVYPNDYLAKYVKGVNGNSGVVSLDCSIYRNGSIGSAQLSQLAYIKSVVRDGAAGTVYEDILRYKASHMMSNNGNYELPNNSDYDNCISCFGNDGDALYGIPFYAASGNSTLYALAAGEWAWNYRVDLLNSSQYYNGAVITFPTTGFATNFKIQKSTNSTTWTDVVNVPSNAAGGTYWYNFPRQNNTNYVRVIAYAPNGAGQTGTQMAVSRFELYDQPNVALKRSAYLRSNTTGGDLPPNSGIYVAANGVDGNSSTWAQAGGEWAWNYLVALFMPTKFNQVKVTFPASNFATQFTIDISNDTATWTTIKSVTGNTTGGTKTYNIGSVKTANYIRVKALAPNGPNQTGVQMGITELEVYYN